MIRKTMLLALATSALLALAAPPIAGAQLLEEQGGVVLAKGAGVTATSGNTKVNVAGGVLTCQLIVMHTDVSANGVATSELKSNLIQTVNCKLHAEGGGELNAVIEGATAVLDFVAGGKGSSALTFNLTISGIIKCHLVGTPVVAYKSGFSAFSFNGKLAVTGAGCGMESQIQGDFGTETANQALVAIS